MESGVVTICLVNYKTVDLTRICLENIRQYTHFPYKLMVIDNNSQDASTEYLNGLDWIELVDRKAKDPCGGHAHAAALDMGLGMCDTEYFMTIHSDTIVHQDSWLMDLMAHFKNDSRIACVGGGKCHLEALWREWLKKTFDFKAFLRKVLRTPDPTGRYRHFNRTVCSIYRTDILKQENLFFLMDRDKNYTAGRKLYFELLDRGYHTVELSDRVMRRYIWHVGHATQVINKDTGNYPIKRRTCRKTRRLIEKVMNSNQSGLKAS